MKKIERAVASYRKSDRYLQMITRQKEYQYLVDQYGVEVVAAASGLTLATLKQYLRVKCPNIGYEPLEQAKQVLQKIKQG